MIGPDIYRAFFAGYTRKQWGVDPKALPASILKRLPLRFTYDDNYFFHRHQGIPEHGYTAMTDAMLSHDLIEVRLGQKFAGASEGYQGHVFYTGSLDQFFGFAAGALGYRTLDFEEIRSEDDFQGVAVLNYCDEDVPWTRVSDHKYFAPWRLDETRGSFCYREFSRSWQEGDIRYYPIRLQQDKDVLRQYVGMVESAEGVTFLGRLGTYRYLDMDVAIAEALKAGQQALSAFNAGAAPKSCYVDLGT